ncbi:M28 family metallopeptidase [Woodsholea maritima]|uniref:M28 family metallopeptidase n=1 Tax=Woodsholea maritima TaxID=240237 RepID=UPI0003A4336D|nr:M28 family metallopeptidase [Woodsholea maritima]
MKHLMIGAVSLLALSACASTQTTTAMAPVAPVQPTVTADAIEAHIRFLADNLLEGRDTGERGYDIASLYVASQFRLLGLEPGGDSGDYYASVPLQKVTLDPEGSSLKVNGEDLIFGEEFLMAAHTENDMTHAEGELVFVGFGLDAEQFGLNDYADVDVEGKIVVMFSGTPHGLPSDVAAHLGSNSTKEAIAASHGAKAMITIVADHTSRYPFSTYAQYATRPSMSVRNAGTPLEARLSVSQAAAEKLFADADVTVADLAAKVEAEEALTSFALPAHAEVTQSSTREDVKSQNVVGVLPGSDPALANETVVITAHLDHIGICRLEEAEDRICNGALDNASGSAIMLETARALSEGERPKRSVVFVALTGEEKGLLGSQYIARNPTPAMGDMVANINLDMPVIVYEFNDLIAFGAEHSSLGPITSQAAETAGAYISEDPMPEQSLFVRSDHYNFVKVGVPSIFLMTGFSSPDEADDEGKGFLGFLGGNYHGPGDDVMQNIRYDQGAKFARINFQILQDIANADERPHWNEDSYFGKAFGQQ